MSEVQSRPSAPRGRGSHRGGRGGYRGGRGASKNTKSDSDNIPQASEDQGEIGALKKKHGSKVSTVQEMFPDWTEEDVVYALEETGGDLEGTVDGITSGSISQWGEVAKKADRSRSKVKDSHASHDTASGTRGARGRGGYESRARGRGADRGRSGRGGRANSQSNGTRASDKPSKPVQDGWGDEGVLAAPVPVEATGSWADAATNGDGASIDPRENAELPKESATRAGGPASHVIPSTKVSGWAGLFAKPAPEPVPKKVAAPASTSTEEAPEPAEDIYATTPVQPPPVETSIDSTSSDIVDSIPSEPALNLTPSKNELTHDNLEQIPDISQPIASATAASTVASTQDPLSNLNSARPTIRPGMSGYATSALKATTAASGRSSSFQRRVLEQQEAVVMPENHAVSRAALQFGSMNINGSPGDVGPEEDREEPETRTQLPDDSPVAPRASLPPPAAVAPPQAPAEPPTAPKAAPGLPPAPSQQQQQSASPPQANAYADQFARYGQPSQKSYDAFGQQSHQQQPPQQAPPVAQDAISSQAASQGQTSSTSGPSEYAAYYGQDAQRNLAYQNFYSYNQNQEAQQRSGSAFGNLADSQPQYATSRPQAGVTQQEAQHSGQNTPNPPQQSNQQPQQPPQNMHQGQGSHAGYPYGYANAGYNQQYPQYATYMNQMNQQHQYGQNRPMFDDARRYDEAYMSHSNQYGGNQYGGRQYSGSHYNKSGMYNQPQHQYSYEQSSSPATAATLNQTAAGRDGSYGRTGSTQPSESQQAGSATAFGGINDPFSRDQSGYGGHTPMSQQHPGQISLDDHAKSYDASKAAGPSPQIKNAHRPASAANNSMQAHQQAGAQQPAGYPGATQSQQGTSQQQQHAGFGAYPQYGSFGANIGGGGHQGQHQQQHQQQGAGAGGQGNHPAQSTQQQQQYGYGGASAAGFGNYSAAGYGSGRGWSGSYGAGH